MLWICPTWSITLNLAKPCSSAATAIRAKSSRSVGGPPGHVKLDTCTPTCIDVPPWFSYCAATYIPLDTGRVGLGVRSEEVLLARSSNGDVTDRHPPRLVDDVHDLRRQLIGTYGPVPDLVRIREL